MARLSRTKQDLLREVVRENLEVMYGRPPRVLRRGSRARGALLRGLRLVILPALVLTGVSALSLGGGRSPGPQEAASVTLPVPATLSAPTPFNPATFPLEVKKVALDAGHGGKDVGAPTPFGLWEKDITLDVARRLRVLLSEAGFEVVMTREGDETVSLRQRAALANQAQADVFVSIHFNSLPTRGYRGVETYFVGQTDDPEIERLAGLENRGSGYSLADFRRLLDGVYAHARQRESRAFAEATHGEFVETLGKANPTLRDNGVKTAPFLVLVATEMPGILAEASVLSNPQEARLVADPTYRHKIARALFAGIRAYADARNRPGGQGSL